MDAFVAASLRRGDDEAPGGGEEAAALRGKRLEALSKALRVGGRYLVVKVI